MIVEINKRGFFSRWRWRLTGVAIILVTLALFFGGRWMLAGAGAWQRTFTVGGIYAVCKPSGYETVCFVNKDGGAIACLPLRSIQPESKCL